MRVQDIIKLRTLATLCNALLSTLLSGEMRVKDAARFNGRQV